MLLPPWSGSAPSPLHGAAYRELILRYHVTSCDSPEHADEITRKVQADIVPWADTQPDDVREAYRWAVEQTVADLARRGAAMENARRINEAHATLPKPPL